MHTAKPKLFKVVPSTLEAKLLQQDQAMIMPKRMANGALLVCGRLGNWTPELIPIKDAVRLSVLAANYVAADQPTQIAGFVAVIDVKGLKTSHIALVSPLLAQTIVKFAEKAFPGRPELLHALHVVNNSNVFEAAVNFFMKFTSKDYKEKIQVHGDNLSSLHKCVPPELLPNEFGGTAGPMDTQPISKKIMAASDKLVKFMECDYDQKKGKKQQ